MSSAAARDPQGAADAAAWAKALSVSTEAVDLYRQSDVIDLHVDSFIWTRVFGYDLSRRHGRGLLGGRYYSQVDFPRMREAGVSGALWSITTNPFRLSASRARAFASNLDALERICAAARDQVVVVRDYAAYRAAHAAGKHAVLISVQGGNALDADDQLALLQTGAVVAVTLVHLSSSSLGASSSPISRRSGLTPQGRDYIRRLNELRVFVDLAHMQRDAFFQALDAHDPSRPLLVSHTGVSGVHSSWRNLDDAQLKAVADTGGVIGVIFHGGYLGGSYWSGGWAELIVDHLAHIVRTVGDDHAALGSDWDGAIITPRDMRTCLELPRLVQHMLERGFTPQRIQKILGGNFLRALRDLRG
jgi:membrane dipeptidase